MHLVPLRPGTGLPSSSSLHKRAASLDLDDQGGEEDWKGDFELK
jgi:hypothetical protein